MLEGILIGVCLCGAVAVLGKSVTAVRTKAKVRDISSYDIVQALAKRMRRSI